MGSDFACMKQGNALFYPVNATSGAIVGSTSGNAGHRSVSDCRNVLPQPFEVVSCAKQGNALYYPFNYETGKIIGSTSGNAGYRDAQACMQTLN